MSNHAINHFHFNFVHEAVRQQAMLNPDKPALIDQSGDRINYQELSQRSARLARRLRSLGVRPDDRVAIWMDRSIDLIVSILAILEAGGAYVPIDTSYPRDRIAVMLENSDAAALIADLDVPPKIAGAGLTIINPAHVGPAHVGPAHVGPAHVGPAHVGPEVSDATGFETGLKPDNLAYVIYTSGSMGSPKGVAMSHRGLTRLIRWQIDDGPPSLSTLQFTPICFDVIFQEVFSTLCTGGALWLVSDALRRDPERLLAALNENSIQRLFLPYVALQQLAAASRRLGLAPQTLRHVITAGERLIITEAISDFFGALPACRLDNHYGPTEAHLVTSLTLSRDPADWPTLPSIGSTVGGVTLYNLDDRLTPVPPGKQGELYVGGEGVARGYLNAPDLTAEAYLPDPFGSAEGTRMYKTGDVVCIGADGIVDFVGRVDNQIKVRGFRVEPAEVELALTDHPRVQQAAVGLRTIAADVKALVGYVVTDAASVTVSDLAKHVRATLPEYMVPSRFVFLDALPLTPSGKVDQRLLSEIAIPDPAADSPPASDSLVDIVRTIWERVLGHDDLELDDDFFDVGGDSLLATWAVTELSQALGREIELSVLLQDSTLAGIARTLEGLALQGARARRTSEALTLRAGPSQRALFLVHPLGGELLAYRALARSIKSPLRVLGLRWQPEEAPGTRSMTLPEMAAVHCQQVRSIQPHGPYLLAGWSFGGVLAFELAQQVMASGDWVDFLGLLDANPVLDPTTGLVTSESPLFDRLTTVLAEIDRNLESGMERDGLAHLLEGPDLRALLGNTIPEGVTVTHLRKNLHITRDSVWAAMNYRAAPYSGALDLFQPEDSSLTIKESMAIELRRLARGACRIHSVPGDHYSLLRSPQVEMTGRAIDEALEAIARG